MPDMMPTGNLTLKFRILFVWVLCNPLGVSLFVNFELVELMACQFCEFVFGCVVDDPHSETMFELIKYDCAVAVLFPCNVYALEVFAWWGGWSNPYAFDAHG